MHPDLILTNNYVTTDDHDAHDIHYHTNLRFNVKGLSVNPAKFAECVDSSSIWAMLSPVPNACVLGGLSILNYQFFRHFDRMPHIWIYNLEVYKKFLHNISGHSRIVECF